MPMRKDPANMHGQLREFVMQGLLADGLPRKPWLEDPSLQVMPAGGKIVEICSGNADYKQLDPWDIPCGNGFFGYMVVDTGCEYFGVLLRPSEVAEFHIGPIVLSVSGLSRFPLF
jgi:hypothetical protein